jgi:hypothetical protein
MVIRRASDSTTQTIGFDANGNIDEAAINTFCSGTTCTVYQWIDQSGNGNTATAAAQANEPTIYTGGALVKDNGKMALDFDGSDDVLALSSVLIQGTTGRTIFSVINADAQSNDGIVALNTGSASSGGNYNLTSEPVLRVSGGNQSWSGADLSSQNLATLTLPDSSGVDDANLYLSGSLASQVSTTTTTINTANQGTTQIGAFSSTTFDGRMQEVLLYASDKSSNRTDIESNVGDYFTQNTPLLDTYSGAAAAYSLRKLSSSYSGALIRVRRSSDNTELDINANVFGELDTVSLLAFAGAGDAFVKTWYDQSGNSNDATQTATGSQPQIVSSGAVIVENGRVSLSFNSNKLELTGISWTSTRSIFTVLSPVLFDGFDPVFGTRDASGNFAALIGTTANYKMQQYPSGGFNNRDTGITITTDQQLTYTLFNGSNSSIAKDGSSITSVSLGSAGAENHSIGSRGTDGGDGEFKIQEHIVYLSDQSANRTNIESNINTFYSIY